MKKSFLSFQFVIEINALPVTRDLLGTLTFRVLFISFLYTTNTLWQKMPLQQTLFPATPSMPLGPGKPSTPGTPIGPSLPFVPGSPTGPYEKQ